MKYEITQKDGWQTFVNGIWFDDCPAMADAFWGENLWVEEFGDGKIIWCGLQDTPEFDTYYVEDGIKISDIVKAISTFNELPDDGYDPVLDGGRGFSNHIVELATHAKYAGQMVISFKDGIDALDNIKPMSEFKKDHPNFKYDVYKEICNAVNEFEYGADN